MADGQLPGLIQHLRLAVAPRNSPGVSDAQLLERFVAQRDESAFELLVWRHGKMVLGTCRRLLRDAHAAEDAFQACFLALARRAGSIGRRESVGGWLHKVAFRLALRAKSRTVRREAREQPLDDFAPPGDAPDPASEAARREERRALDEEVGRLPDKFRVPFVLCYFEGLSNADVARELGCPVGTVESRLTRARQRLCAGLSRRGVTAPAGVLALPLAMDAMSGFVPASLAISTAKAATLAATGEAVAAGLVSAHVAALTEGVLRAMFMTKLKTAAAVLVAAALAAGTGAGALTYYAPADDAPGKLARAPETGDAAKVAKLIEQLGSDDFAEREKATKQLDEIGAAALPALRKAAGSGDAEQKKRVRDLLQKIEGRVETARVLTPKRLRLVYKDTPLADAVEDFKKKSGYDLGLHDPEGKLKGRTVTLDTGEVTFWRALAQFCEKAGLVEAGPSTAPAGGMMRGMGAPMAPAAGAWVPAMPARAAAPGAGGPAPPADPTARPGGAGKGAAGAPANPAAAPPAAPGAGAGRPGGAALPAGGGGAGGAGGGLMPPAAAPGAGAPGMPGAPGGMARFGAGGMALGSTSTSFVSTASRILLADGKHRALPTDDRTAVRIRALDKDAAGMGRGAEGVLTLEVTLEPKLRWQQLAGINVTKAIDDQGQAREQAAPAAEGGPGAAILPPAAAGAILLPARAVPPAAPAGGGAGGRPGMAPPAARFVPAGAALAGWVSTHQDTRSRMVPIRLKPGAKSAKSLKEISGTISARVFGEPRPLITVADVLDSAGKTAKGAEGGSIRVIDVTREPDGRFTRLTLRLELDLPGGAPSHGSLGGERFVLGDGGFGSSRHELGLVDKDGNLLPPVRMGAQGGAKGVEFLLSYYPRRGQGEPAKLVLTESKAVAVEVPFTLKDVPLP